MTNPLRRSSPRAPPSCGAATPPATTGGSLQVRRWLQRCRRLRLRTLVAFKRLASRGMPRGSTCWHDCSQRGSPASRAQAGRARPPLVAGVEGDLYLSVNSGNTTFNCPLTLHFSEWPARPLACCAWQAGWPARLAGVRGCVPARLPARRPLPPVPGTQPGPPAAPPPTLPPSSLQTTRTMATTPTRAP